MKGAKRIYFLRPVGAMGPVKIGCSINPVGRLASTLIWSPLMLEIVATVEGGHEFERALHDRFAKQRLHGEWFAESEELTGLIDRLRAGGCLPPIPAKPHRLNRDTSSALIERAREIYDAGAPICEVADRLQCSAHKATKLVRLSGAELRTRGRYGHPFRLTDTERARRMCELRRAGWTLQAIGDRYGLTRERVRQIIQKAHAHGLTSQAAA